METHLRDLEFDACATQSDSDDFKDQAGARGAHWRRHLIQGLLATILVATVIVAATGMHRWRIISMPQPTAQTLLYSTACSNMGENCINSGCCNDPNLKCYEKDPGWAVCKQSCTQGIDLNDQQEARSPWSCAVKTQPGFVEHVQATTATPTDACSPTGQNCMTSKCCKDPGMQCYMKDPGWATCRSSCNPGQVDQHEPQDLQTPWNCNVVTHEQHRKPVLATTIATTTAAPTTPKKCSNSGEDCLQTKCCNDPSLVCYEKHSRWGTCKRNCVPGVDLAEVAEAQTPWSCNVQSASVPSTLKQINLPSLFCFTLMLPHSYEVNLVKSQFEHSVGIFDCNEYAVFSNTDIELSAGPPRVATHLINGSLKCEFGGIYHTALNSEVFVRVWKKLIIEGMYMNNDWTVKVDPDTVFIPRRLRNHVRKKDPNSILYFNNCAEGLHGPIEVIAKGAMQVYNQGFQKCLDSLKWEWSSLGEDVFVRHCLGMLHVNRVDDFDLLREKACKPFKDPIPCTSGSVAFHPLKSQDEWYKCYSQAQRMY